MRQNSMKPDFLIIGAAKAATTSLSTLLSQHPEAAIVQGKEPHFFSIDDRYKLGWDNYQALFAHCTDEKMVGDASTSYSRVRYHPHVLQRIKYHVPDVKIIYMVRHPLERMESAYIEHLATSGGNAFSSISDAVTRLPMIIDSSRYWEVFDAYRQYFPENHIKIVWFEEYVNDRVSVYQDVCRFLGIEDTYVPDSNKENINDRASRLKQINRSGQGDISIDTAWDPDVMQHVISLIRVDNTKFLHHFGKPDDYWGDLF